jgi:hypothetical protein
LPDASGTIATPARGVVNIGAQSFAGTKTSMPSGVFGSGWKVQDTSGGTILVTTGFDSTVTHTWGSIQVVDGSASPNELDLLIIPTSAFSGNYYIWQCQQRPAIL